MADLTVATAFQKACPAEVVTQEAKVMQEPSQVTTGQEEDMHKLSIHFKCYRCGKQGHSAVECKHKMAKCRLCQKVGHFARVCQAAGSKSSGTKHLNLPENEVVYEFWKIIVQVTAVPKTISTISFK